MWCEDLHSSHQNFGQHSELIRAELSNTKIGDSIGCRMPAETDVFSNWSEWR